MCGVCWHMESKRPGWGTNERNRQLSYVLVTLMCSILSLHIQVNVLTKLWVQWMDLMSSCFIQSLWGRLITLFPDRLRQPRIVSAKCWLSTRRTSKWWRTMRSWPVMWVQNMQNFSACVHMDWWDLFSVDPWCISLFVRCHHHLIFVCFLSASSCWNGSAAPSRGCRTEPKRRP